MTYNLKEIMTAAWSAFKTYKARGFSNSFASCLSHAWYQARCKVAQARANVAPMTRRNQLQAQIARLEYSDAFGSIAKLIAARRELATLPLAA